MFEVFGQAEGLASPGGPRSGFYPSPSTSREVKDLARDMSSSFEANDPIVLDLKFPPPARLTGRVVDDRGRPIPGARLEIRGCEPIHRELGLGTSEGIFTALNEIDSVPGEMKVRSTDDDGRFAFDGLPAEVLFRIDVRPKGYPNRWICAATSNEPHPDHAGLPVLIGDLTLTFATPVEVPIRVMAGDTGRPAAKVLVGVGGPDGIATSETTDAEGRVTLRIPPATYRMELLPERGTPYLVTEAEIVAEGPDKPIVATLRPAAILEVTAIDGETGAGVPDVDLWEEKAAAPGAKATRELIYFRSWEVATRIAHVDRPRTDDVGKLRALVEPGTHRVGVGLESRPIGYRSVDPRSREVSCRPGETVPLEFTFRKRPQ